MRVRSGPTFLLFILVLAGTTGIASTTAKAPTVVVPVADSLFRPLAIPPTPDPTPSPSPTPTVSPTPEMTPNLLATRPPITQPTPRAQTQPRNTAPPIGKHSVKGIASWYCNYDDSSYVRSACHHSYPDKAGQADLYAAACGKLRRAMGNSWRGKYVTVKGHGHSVRVRLIDWCGSETKTIDLYRDSMDVLGPSSGGYNVTISW